MSKAKYIGTIVEHNKGDNFIVEFGNGQKAMCYLAGKLHIYHIRVVLGDMVEFELSEIGGRTQSRGRIVKRL